MGRTRWIGVPAVGLVALGVAGTSSTAFGSQSERPAIRILVHAVPGVPIDVLRRAKDETARIYADAGVTVVWADSSKTLPRLTMLIIANPDAWPTRLGVDALGAAPAADDGPGRLAYAFYDRIQAVAGRHGTDAAMVLAQVMAHELGHLLLGRDAHSPTGIMSDRWNSFQMGLTAVISMRFTNKQAKSIRQSVADMNANLK